MIESLSITKDEILRHIVASALADESIRRAYIEAMRESVLLTARQGARLLSMHENHFRSLPIDSIDIGKRGKRYPLSAIRAWQKENQIRAHKRRK